MVAIDLKSLVGRLGALCRRQLEAAAGLTLSRSHYNVEIEHLLLRLVETQGSDVALILSKSGVDAGRVAAELTRALDRLRTGNARAPSLSPDIVTWLREAWVLASLEGSGAPIRSGHLLAALLTDETLVRSAKESAPSLLGIQGDSLRRGGFEALAAGGEEAAEAATAAP
ncbi:MAG: type VI secretion system ATPase TssH, partial [Acetobacteraceae bacterium]|nr:type VI secretion system ATPase TssH [Acetobacteraceae bacterium]